METTCAHCGGGEGDLVRCAGRSPSEPCNKVFHPRCFRLAPRQDHEASSLVCKACVDDESVKDLRCELCFGEHSSPKVALFWGRRFETVDSCGDSGGVRFLQPDTEPEECAAFAALLSECGSPDELYVGDPFAAFGDVALQRFGFHVSEKTYAMAKPVVAHSFCASSQFKVAFGPSVDFVQQAKVAARMMASMKAPSSDIVARDQGPNYAQYVPCGICGGTSGVVTTYWSQGAGCWAHASCAAQHPIWSSGAALEQLNVALGTHEVLFEAEVSACRRIVLQVFCFFDDLFADAVKRKCAWRGGDGCPAELVGVPFDGAKAALKALGQSLGRDLGDVWRVFLHGGKRLSAKRFEYTSEGRAWELNDLADTFQKKVALIMLAHRRQVGFVSKANILKGLGASSCPPLDPDLFEERRDEVGFRGKGYAFARELADAIPESKRLKVFRELAAV